MHREPSKNLSFSNNYNHIHIDKNYKFLINIEGIKDHVPS
jgi:hypothetical protein